MRIDIQGLACELLIREAQGGGFNVRVIAAEDGVLGATAVDAGTPIVSPSCRLDAWHFEPDEVAIKGYGEHAGIIDVLVAAGAIARPHMHLDLRGSRAPGPRRVSGPAEAEAYVGICRLSPAAMASIATHA